MKKYILILCILVLSCCAKQHGSWTQTGTVNASPVEDDKTKPLMIGGKQYRTRNSLEPSKEKPLTLGDIDDIEILIFDIDPFDRSKMNGLEGIEQLYNTQNIQRIGINGKNLDNIDLSPLEQFSNITFFYIRVNGSGGVLPDLSTFTALRELHIYRTTFEQPFTLNVSSGLTDLDLGGTNLHNVDLSVIESLYELRSIQIHGDIARLPDLTSLENLHSIRITNSLLESLEGIGAPNVKEILEIETENAFDSLAPLNNLLYLEYLDILSKGEKTYRIADMANLPRLKDFTPNFWGGAKIDFRGIERMSALEKLHASSTQPFNIEGIGALANLKVLSINLISLEPSLEFIRDMPNIHDVYIFADRLAPKRGYDFAARAEAYQILDVSPLATLKNLQSLTCRNFIIKNISALDVIDVFGEIDLINSRLYDETEKSKHNLIFESHR